MRKNLLLLVAFCSINVAFAQFYVSASGGYSMGSAGILTGTSLNEAQTKATNHYGSYGEGYNVQLRGGYFFNKMFGLELSLGYLGGADQNISYYLKNDDGAIKEYVEGLAHAEAFGINLALAYNFNENFYGKIGVVSKLGGKTETTFTRTNPTPFGPIVAEGINDYHGRPPLGFTAAFGYKYKLTDNLNLFAELEYLGINVTRDRSEFAELTINYPAVPAAVVPGGIPAGTWNLGDAPINHPVYGIIYAPSEIEYVDSLPEPNNDPTKALSSVAPYSSFGINIGITYTFSKKGA
jgi:opacity protein-like surface antigen